jgi:predicted permease
MLAEFRYAVRTLSRNRGFTLVTVLTLALGIGSAASIFSVADWVLFRANKFPEDVFLVGGQSAQGQFLNTRMDFMARAYEEQCNAMSEWAKAAYMTGNVVVEGQPVGTTWMAVSPNLFPMLGATMTLGRGFLPGEDREGSDHVVVVTHHFWQTHLGGRDNVLGCKIVVGDAICTVVGVTAAAKTLPNYLFSDVYRPLAYHMDPAKPWEPTLLLHGRLRPGFTREQAVAALAAVKIDVPPMLRGQLEEDRPALASMGETKKWVRVEIYWVLLGAVGFLYAIACLNASNLMLVRMLGQRRELCIRLALGCGRWRLVRLMAMEGAMLAALASVAGALVANWFFPLLLSAAGNSALAPKWNSWTLDPRVVGVLAVLSLLTSLCIVAIPAWRVFRADINPGLKDGGAALGESRALARLRGSFVVLQAAFAVMLLAGAGLMIETFHRLQQVDLGFDPAGRAKVTIGFPADYPPGQEAMLVRLHEIQARIQRVPGVRDVGFGSDFLLPGYYFPSSKLEGPAGKEIRAAMGMFNVGFDQPAGLTLKRGRWLRASDLNEVMVNESLARVLWPDRDPIGQLLRPTNSNPSSEKWTGWAVTGVVGDIRSTMREAPGLWIYGPETWGGSWMNAFIVRFSRDFDETLAGMIRRDLYSFDSRMVVHQIRSLNAVRDDQLWAERMANSVLKVLAGIALLLTVVGIFSVLAYTVDRRMGEFGVRLALGATRRNLVELVLRRGVVLTLVGIGLGVGGTLALTRYLKSLLFETSAQDPWVLAAVGGILLVTSVLACALPARRATRVDISRLLRSE